MAAPVFQSSSALAGSFTASADIPIPSGVVAGDVVVLSVYDEGSGAITPPAGFTLKQTVTCTGSRLHTQNIYWKRATGAEGPGVYSFTFGGAVWNEGWAIRVSGCVASGDPFGAPINTATTNSTGGPYTATPTVATLTPSENDCLVLFSGTIWNGGGNTWTPPSGFTERVDSETGTLATLSQTTAAATGSVSATTSNSDPGLTGLVAYLRPVVVSGVPVTVRCTVGIGSVVTAKKDPRPLLRAPVGVASTVAGRKVSPAVLRAPLGLAGSAAARKSRAVTGLVALGLAVRGTVRKTTPATGRAAAGVTPRALATKVSRPQLVGAVGFGPVVTARKSVAVVGLAAFGVAGSAAVSAVGAVAVTLRLAVGFAGSAVAGKRAPAVGTSAVGVAGSAAGRKVARSAPVAVAGVAGTAGAAKRTPVTGRAVAGVAGTAAGAKKTPVVGRSAVGIAARAAARRVVAVGGRAFVGLRGSAGVGATLLPATIGTHIGTIDDGPSLIGEIEEASTMIGGHE